MFRLQLMLSFRKIDENLSIYYSNCGLSNYYNKDGNGLFLKYIIEEELNDISLPIEDEIGSQCDPHNCSYTDFDSKFPIPQNINDMNIFTNHYFKEEYIFFIIQYCYKYNHPPSIQCMLHFMLNK